MNIMRKSTRGHHRPPAPSPGGGHSPASSLPGGPAHATGTTPGASPPHLLWATLESAYARPRQAGAAVYEERLPLYLSAPIAVGLALCLWAIIIELVLRR